MEKAARGFLWILIIFTLALSACDGGDQTTGAPDTGVVLDRPEPPAEFANLANPFAGDETAVVAGKDIYQNNCVACHGEQGKGDGPAAASLNPKPQNLAANESGLSDAYLYWRIAEGGAMSPFNSAMPAWKSVMSEDEIWQMVNYIHSLN